MKTMVLPVHEVSPVGFHAKFIKAGGKPYKVSSGKSRMLRRAIILIFVSLFIITASLKFIPASAYEKGGWMEIILWTPRIVSMGLALLAILLLRDMRKIKEFLSFDKAGITYEQVEIAWDEVKNAYVEYSTTTDEQYELIIETESESYRIDISKVDEFSEDVAVVFSKYWKLYSKSGSQVKSDQYEEEV